LSTNPLTFLNLQSISFGLLVNLIFLIDVPLFIATEVPFTFKSLIKITVSPST